MSQTIHMCIDIEGVLNWPDAKLRELFVEDGHMKSGRYIRDWLKLQLHQGKKVLPMGKCEGFSFIDGCPGHENNEEK